MGSPINPVQVAGRYQSAELSGKCVSKLNVLLFDHKYLIEKHKGKTQQLLCPLPYKNYESTLHRHHSAIEQSEITIAWQKLNKDLVRKEFKERIKENKFVSLGKR